MGTGVDVQVGATATVTLVVDEADTAAALGSGSVPVLGTPRMVALCEEATCAAVAGGVPDGATTVGVHVSLDHLRPTAVGGEVAAVATVTAVEGRRIVFDVSAADAGGVVASGTVVRVVVDTARFLAAL